MKRTRLIAAILVAVLICAALPVQAVVAPRVIIGADTAPTITSCGASSALTAGSSDGLFEVVMTTNATASCTLTFGQTYAVAPACWGILQGVANPVPVYSSTTTTAVITLNTGITSSATVLTGGTWRGGCSQFK